MDNLKSELDLLESLSKKISDLIYKNEFAQISNLDTERRKLIKKIMDSEISKNNIKKRIKSLVEKNVELVKTTEKKLHVLSKNHNKYNNRLKAYSFTK